MEYQKIIRLKQTINQEECIIPIVTLALKLKC